jgi:Zn-dependent protease
MAGVTALLLLVSVVVHELAHSLIARTQGIEVHNITLFIFGGTAQIGEEPKSARSELLIALAGPIASLLLASFFWVLEWVSLPNGVQFHALAGWLAWINLVLALFNLIPGFPLDGGRIFRAIVWAITGNLRRATQIAMGVGQIIAYGIIYWGIWQIFDGNWADGVWIVFIGWFLVIAALAGYRQQALRKLLSGHTVREVMMTDYPRILSRLTLDVVVDHVVLAKGRRCFVVIEDDQVQGLLTPHRINRVPRERWATIRVEDVMIPRHKLKTVGPNDDLGIVFERMAVEDINQFPVLDSERGQVLGIVARDNVLTFLRSQSEFGLKSSLLQNKEALDGN